MARGVFLHRADSIYEDHPETRYQFPPQYLSRASRFVGDWILYYEPRRGPTGKGYFAVAKVERIVPDPSAPGMHLALIGPGRSPDRADAMVWAMTELLLKPQRAEPRIRSF